MNRVTTHIKYTDMDGDLCVGDVVEFTVCNCKWTIVGFLDATTAKCQVERWCGAPHGGHGNVIGEEVKLIVPPQDFLKIALKEAFDAHTEAQ